MREVWEETGLRVKPLRVVGIFSDYPGFRHSYPNGDQVEYMVALFACQVVGDTLGEHDNETVELRYFSPDTLPPLPIAYPRQLFQSKGVAETYFEWDET